MVLAQAQDNFCSKCCANVTGSTTPLPDRPAFRYFERHKARFTIDDVNDHRTLLFDGAIVVPQAMQERVMTIYHEGHFNAPRMMFRLKRRFWWYKLTVKSFASLCTVCAQCKSGGAIRCPRGQLPAPGPYELVFIDIVGPLPRHDGYQFLLTIEDAFTKFARAIPLRSIATDNIATAVYRHWIGTFHAPSRLHSDNGKQFTSEQLQQFV